MHQIENLVDCR